MTPGSTTDLEAIQAAFADEPLGYRLSAEALDWPLIPPATFDRVAVHPTRPLLLIDTDHNLVDPSGKQR